MTGKLLQALGVVFVLTLVGGAIFGFAVLKDRVRLVVESDAATMGPDATALLRDDVQALGRELAALTPALGDNFNRLANGLEERADGRHTEVMALRQQLAALQQRVDALVLASAAMQRQLEHAASAPSAPVASETRPPVEQPVEPPSEVPAVIAESTPALTPELPPTTKPQGFLSFSLPSTKFHFDQPQDYVLVPELCRVGFDAKSTLHDFTGVTSKVAGRFRADFDDAAGAWTGEVTAQASTLQTGVDGRDENMREHLDTKNHPAIRFELVRFEPSAGGVDVGKQTTRGALTGKMTIRGQTQPLTMPVAIEVDAQKRVVVTGQAPLKLSDYAVPVPSQLGLINMQDEVVVWIALRARVQAGGGK